LDFVLTTLNPALAPAPSDTERPGQRLQLALLGFDFLPDRSDEAYELGADP
jgi:hypothetical protein